MLEYDLVLCAPDPSTGDVATAVMNGLERLGFRVARAGVPAEALPSPAATRAMAEAPDFVLIWTAAVLDHDTTAIVRALETERNVVVVASVGDAPPEGAGLPPALRALAHIPVVALDPERERESIAVLSHRLSSDSLLEERRLMRRTKRLFAAAVALCLLGVALQEVPILIREWTRPRLPPPIAPFVLYWTAFGERAEGGTWREFPVADKGEVRMGDRLRFVFSPSGDGHAYVVSRDQRGEIHVLYPTDIVTGASKVQRGKVYTAPVGDGWLTVEGDSAPVAVYLVGSYDPLQNLEELIEEPTARAVERRQLVTDTLNGLLDGRHAALNSRVWTGKLQTINPDLPVPPGPPPVTAVMMSGARASHPLVSQPGWVAAAVELALTVKSPGLPLP